MHEPRGSSAEAQVILVSSWCFGKAVCILCEASRELVAEAVAQAGEALRAAFACHKP